MSWGSSFLGEGKRRLTDWLIAKNKKINEIQIVQSTATILAAFVQVGVKEWMFANVKDICDVNQKSNLTCPHNQVFFTASAIW